MRPTTEYQMTGGTVTIEAMPQALYTRLLAQFNAKNPPPSPPLVHINADDPDAEPIYESNVRDVAYLKVLREHQLTFISSFASALFQRCVTLSVSDAERDAAIRDYINATNAAFGLDLTFEDEVAGDPHGYYIDNILSMNELETEMLYEYIVQNAQHVTRDEINQRRLLFRHDLQQ